ncbi:MAG: transglycosylase SLT domain-containing protein [Prolixibacteraceae bacterium]|nr:transglycosylase SLT domain-containing protein [Prolixibacteraceae bacterium]
MKVLFWGILLPINLKYVFPFLKKGLKKIIRKQVLRNKKRRRLNKYIFTVLIVGGIYLFQFCAIDFLIEKYTFQLSSIIININRKNYSGVVEKADYSGIKSIVVDKGKISNTPLSSDYGRFLRTFRWSPFIEKAEKSYGIEKGLLAGLIMQESYGNPLELNSGNDGGAGLMMFQPGTGAAYGLKIYGSSSATGRDKIHGHELRDLLVTNKYNYEILSTIDERFHVAKSIDAGARFITELYGNHKSWDNAVSAYNRGTPALVPQSTKHVRKVRHYQKQYLVYLKGISKNSFLSKNEDNE